VTTICAETARDATEAIAGTAPEALGWLLIERAGPWGRDALTESGIDRDVGAAVAAVCKRLPVKPVVVRRPGPHVAPRAADGSGREHEVFLVHTGVSPWAERLTIGDDRELLDLDPEVCTSPQPPGLGRRLEDPLFLVCTHGKRDRCCATLGRPLVDTLAALHRDETWEVSHIGGHRFAGNLLVLPDGLTYGGLDVASGLSAAAGHLAGRLDLAHLRGRTALARPVQAAEIAVREHLGLEGVGGVSDIALTSDGDTHRVTIDLEGARTLVVELVRVPIGRRLLSCDADEPEDPHTYEIRSIGRVEGAPDDHA
jgi:hypothetical protein